MVALAEPRVLRHGGLRAFSREAVSGSREENASKTKALACKIFCNLRRDL
jgi:hypothetical protein